VRELKYRAVAVGLVADERPVECFGSMIGPVERWAAATAALRKVPVQIFILEERLIRTERPEMEKEAVHVEDGEKG
jgi:hypothetical protein